jgi:hypothetical protein
VSCKANTAGAKAGRLRNVVGKRCRDRWLPRSLGLKCCIEKLVAITGDRYGRIVRAFHRLTESSWAVEQARQKEHDRPMPPSQHELTFIAGAEFSKSVGRQLPFHLFSPRARQRDSSSFGNSMKLTTTTNKSAAHSGVRRLLEERERL